MQKHINHGRYAPYERPVDANTRLQEVLSNRERYLQRHLHLRVHQTGIDGMLDKSGNVHGRLAVMGRLMQGKLFDMQAECCKLNRFLK